MDGGAAHPSIHETPDSAAGLPQRPPMPTGLAYIRHIPWLGRTLSFVAATMNDLPRLHRWLNDPLVDRFWREAGSLEQHRAYLQRQLDDPHTIPIFGQLDGVPFGYFEVYWAAESLIGPYYQADPFDRGWHVLIGEPDYRGRPFLTAWLPSLMHFIFLDEPRIKRIVGDARCRARPAIAQSGALGLRPFRNRRSAHEARRAGSPQPRALRDEPALASRAKRDAAFLIAAGMNAGAPRNLNRSGLAAATGKDDTIASARAGRRRKPPPSRRPWFRPPPNRAGARSCRCPD